MGVQTTVNEGAAKFLYLDLFALYRPSLKLNSKNILCYAIFGSKAPLRP